jgi:ABC-2 type transport system permease protein
MNPRRILAVARSETKEMLRDRLFFSLAFIVPATLMIIFGYGLSLDVEGIPFAVLDRDGTALSRDYSNLYRASRYFHYLGDVRDEREIDPLLVDNKARVVVVIPEHFEKNLLEGRPVAVQSLLDGTFPFRAQTTKGYITGINQAFGRRLMEDHLSRRMGIDPERTRTLLEPVKLNVRYLYNQGLESDWSMAPKFMMLILMVCPPLLTSLGVVREKETGAVYNIYSSTISRAEYLTGKLAPYVVVSGMNVLALWLLTMGLFDAPFKGGFVLFFFVSLLYVVCTTGIGLVVSVLVSTQVAATLITFIVTVVPAVIYSGVFVPIMSLSESAQVVAHLLPAMYYTNIILGCFLKGVGAGVLWKDILVLAVYASVLFGIGYSRFTKRPSA